MTETVTITHHANKPEYQWEIVVPEGPTVLLKEENLRSALEALGVSNEGAMHNEVEALPNGGSRSITLELDEQQLKNLSEVGVKTVMQS